MAPRRPRAFASSASRTGQRPQRGVDWQQLVFGVRATVVGGEPSISA